MGNSAECCKSQGGEPSPLGEPNDYIPSIAYFVEFFHAGPDSNGPWQVSSTDKKTKPVDISVMFRVRERLKGDTLVDTVIEIDFETVFRRIRIVEIYESAFYEITDFNGRQAHYCKQRGLLHF